MKYFKNTELAKLYKVSEKSVRNWIDAAQTGKLDLQLHEVNGKYFVANVTRNVPVMEKLANRGKKFRNKRGYKIITPKDDFYKLYSPKQIFDIIANIDIHKEIPLQYCYFNGGAKRWDHYVRSMSEQDTSNPFNDTVQLLDKAVEYIDDVSTNVRAINVVDLGVGNGMPVKKLLKHYLDKGLLNRYIGIDTSAEMLKITGDNIQEWFGDSVRYEKHIRDIHYERFDDLLVSDTLNNQDGQTINIVLFLGGTIANFREPNRLLSTIYDSLGKNDFFILTRKLDDEQTRRHFDIVRGENLAITFVPDLLNISSEHYEIEQFFDEGLQEREARMKLKIALTVEFRFGSSVKTLDLNKDDSVLLWRARHQSVPEAVAQFEDCNFELYQLARSRSQQYVQIISKIKTQ